MILWVDFETRSKCDLKTKGAYNYAKDISTNILCMSYAFDDEEVKTWLPNTPFPEKIRHFDGQIRAHNATFERLIFQHVLQLNFKLEQFYCTATQARANCAAGGLDDAARFAGADMKKNHRGAQLIKLLSVPKADGTFNNSDTLMKEMISYCEQDVRVMRVVSKHLRQLSDEELKDYHINEQINDKGILVDVDLAEHAIKYASLELKEIEAEVSLLTNGEITSVRSRKMKEWVLDRVSENVKKLMETYKDGEKKYSIDKVVRANLLNYYEENTEEIPDDVIRVIQCADDLWASSVAKFNRIKDLADVEDKRVRGAFIFAGGSATGRASSYGLQVHNFTRKCANNPDEVREVMMNGGKIAPLFGTRVTDVLKGMLRPAILASSGKSLVVADWAAIEARINPWLSDSKEGEDKLNLFRSGIDIYKVNAAATFHTSIDQVTKEQRQIGKVQELSCGFAGGIGAFAKMGKAYGVITTENGAKNMVNGWRRANPWARPYWSELELAYTQAIRNKGVAYSARRVTYTFCGEHLWYTLPSGRVLCYPFARIDNEGISYAKAAWKPKVADKEWPRARLWKGLACENITQAVANDLLRHALRNLSDVILHCHDEIVIETNKPQEVAEEIKKIMCCPPLWAKGIPLEVEVNTMQRYGK